MGEEINCDLPKILAPSLRELPAKRGEGELTFGSPAAFAAGSVWHAFRAIQSNTPSVSRQKQAADTSDVTTSRIARNQRFRLSGRLGEGGYKKKSLFIIDRVKAKPLFIIQLSVKRWPLFCCARMFGTLFSLNAQEERGGVSRPPLSLILLCGADFIRLFPASRRRERQQRQQC